MISAAAAKFLGAFFRIPLTNMLGGVGMGYFSTAYSLFMPVYAFTVTGLTSAVARMTARSVSQGKYCEMRKIRRTALFVFSVAGLCGSLAVFLLAKPFSILTTDGAEASAAAAMIAPSVLLGCITAVERGYYEGMSNMYPTAVSQVIEGAVKVFAGLKLCALVTEKPWLILRFFPYITDVRAAGAAAGILGVTLSTAGAWLFLAVMGMFVKKPEYAVSNASMGGRDIVRELLTSALPIGIGAVVTNLAGVIDMWTIISCLNADGDMPYFVYGSFAGIALTVFNLVPSVTNMLGKGALTCITEANEHHDAEKLKYSTTQALIVSAVIALPLAFGIGILSEEVLDFLYPMQPDEVDICIIPLKLLMPGMVCLCMSYPLSGMLQAVGKPSAPLKIMLIGTGIKLIGNFFLIPKIGVDGAAVSTSFSYAAILTLSLWVYLRSVGIKLRIKPFAMTAYSGIMCGAAAYTAAEISRHAGLSALKTILLAAAAGGIVYIFMLYETMGVHGGKNKGNAGLKSVS